MSGIRISKPFVIRYAMFIAGLFVGALGCVLAIQARLGVAPWDTFHIGLQKTFGLTIGIWSQIVGVVVILSSYAVAKIKPNVAMFINMICFGSFLDLIQRTIPFWEKVMKRQYALPEPMKRQAG